MIAAARRGQRVIEVLAAANSLNKSLKDNQGRTVAHHAVFSSQRAILELLVTHFNVDFDQALEFINTTEMRDIDFATLQRRPRADTCAHRSSTRFR